MSIEEKIAHIEFRMQLLFNNTDVDRFLFETNVTKEQYNGIIDLLNLIADKLESGQSVHHYEYENGVYEIVPEKNGDYHFCELLLKLFADENQWEEVFIALYGDMTKYKGYKKD